MFRSAYRGKLLLLGLRLFFRPCLWFLCDRLLGIEVSSTLFVIVISRGIFDGVVVTWTVGRVTAGEVVFSVVEELAEASGAFVNVRESIMST